MDIIAIFDRFDNFVFGTDPELDKLNQELIDCEHNFCNHTLASFLPIHDSSLRKVSLAITTIIALTSLCVGLGLGIYTKDLQASITTISSGTLIAVAIGILLFQGFKLQ